MRRQAVAALAALALGAASADAGAGATWHYAPNMFEAQRLETMRQDIKDAEMKVGYSGVFRRPVNDATFRRAAGATGAWRAWGEVLEAVRLPDGGELVHVQARPGDVPAIAGGGPWSVLDAHGAFVAADCVANANPDSGKLPPHLEPFVRTPVPVMFAEGRYDAGRETLGWIYARTAAEPTLFVGESLEELANEDPKHFEQTTKMTAVPGKSGLWCSRVPLAFRYFRFTAPVTDVRVESEMPVLPLKARFAASPRLTRMWQTAAHTINLCMRTFLVDGIKRDRLPWSGDFAVSLLSDAATFREQEVIRRTFRALDAAGPDASDVNTLIDYSLWLVICHDLYQREFADAEFLKRSWPSVRRRVEALLARTDADGFLVKPPKFVTEEVRSWRFIDWTLDAHRSDVALNMILYAALESAARLAERPAVGAAADAARWRGRAKALRSAIRSKALDPATHLFRSRFDGAAPVFLRYANIFAAVFGVAEGREEHEAIGAALEGRTLVAVGTPYVSCFEMLALAKCGRPAGYLACQERIWGGMLDCGATSFWEAWDDRKKDSVAKYEFYKRPFGLSLCHAWGAGPAFLLPRLLVGLEPLEDGYARFAVRPLKEAAGAVYELTLPAGTLKVEVDAHGAAKVSLDGRPLEPAADGTYSPTLTTLFLWKGETQYVWRDFTNAADRAVLVKPVADVPFAKVGVAQPVLGDGNRLVPDRVVWNGAMHVAPGESVRIVAEVRGEASGRFAVRTPLGDAEYAVEVSGREFPKERKVYLDIWQHPWAVARYFNVKPFSKQHYERMRPLWRELASAGQKAITCTIMDSPWAHQCFDAYGTMVRHVRLDKGGWRFDYSRFDEYVEFARACGLGPQIHCYTLCPFRLRRYAWEDERGARREGDFDVGSPEWRDYWTAFLDDFAAHLKAKGWFDATYIGLDERSPAELKAAVDLAKAHGDFKIQVAGDRPPSEFDGIEIDNFSLGLWCMTPKFLAEAGARRKAGKFTTFYTAGGKPCTSMLNSPEHVQWLGVYPGAKDLDGYLRWAFCSWPANPDADATYRAGSWSAGATYLHYPEGPSLRYLGLKNGLNLSEKVKCLRAEGKVDARLQAVLDEFAYKGERKFPKKDALADLLARTAHEIHRASGK